MRWKSQKQTSKQTKRYLDITNAAVAIAKNGFDDEDENF
jgi:hypothetical protein